MIRCTLIATLALIVFSSSAQTEKKTESQISAVTVYQQGAEVVRKATANLSPGTSRLVFTGITDRLDTRSVQVDATGDFVIIAVSTRFDFLQSREREADILKLESRVKEIRREIRMLEARKQVLVYEKNMILANQVVGSQQDGLDVDELRYAAEFFRSRLSNIDTNYVDAERRVDALNAEIGKLNMQLSSLSEEGEGAICEVIVDVSAEQSTKGEFNIRYLVHDARWVPVYDLRVASTKDPIQVDFRSRISQNSGEDWKQARITLSTGDPTASHTKPQLNPWDLSGLKIGRAHV